MTSSYPLAWPKGWPRTPAERREVGRFKVSFAKARDDLADELDAMRASQPVLSTNLPLRLDGQPRASGAEPADPGVALYFYWRKRQYVLACDRYKHVRQNIRAIGLTIEAIRGIERWGASNLMERAFAGFAALEPPGTAPDLSWVRNLGFRPGEMVTLEMAEQAYRRLAKEAHPDTGRGDPERMAELNRAIAQARQALRESQR